MTKYKLGIMILFLLFLYSFEFVQAENRTLPLLGKIIYLDAGHGRYYYAKVVETQIIQ